MAFDEVKIYVRSGDGGDGVVAFRREKYVPRGGPAGGDGGSGGDIVFRVNPKVSTLSYFQKKVHFKAENGKRGGSSNKTGASASSLIIDVPPGTVVKDAESEALLADLIQPAAEFTILEGGRGGRGNSRFVNASNQAPRMAEKGEPGEERWLKLELKMIADVGLVGVPNAGKSTLLSVVSNAKPKIANYPFTTLEPNLGVAIYDDTDLIFADIPGLIEGAHMGVGLGYSFLRHVQRTRMLVHVLDGMSQDVMADYSQINTELALYDDNLRERPQIVVYNKMDIPDVAERWPEVEATFKARGVDVMPISAATQNNIRELLGRVFELQESLPEPEAEKVVEMPVYELEDSDALFQIERESDHIYRVTGKRVERAAAMTYWDYEESILRFQNILETLGISEALEAAGVQVGDTVYIGDFELEWSD